MSIELQQKMSFAIVGSLRDAINQDVPIFHRPSPLFLEKVINGSTQFESAGSFLPAFYSDDGSFLLEPTGVNEITWPQKVNRPEWLKGSNVFVQADRAAAPDGTSRGDRITWAGGAGANQILRRSLVLDPGKVYTLSLYLRLRANGGKFGANDVVRMVGDVVGNPSVNLNGLNGFGGLYRVVELTFTTSGSLPNVVLSANRDFAVTAVTTTTVTVTLSDVTVTANQLVGARVAFNSGATYEITANTASSSQSVTLTLDAVNLPGDGITTSNRAIVLGPGPREVDLELYCESVVSIDWGMADLKQGNFRSSPIPQGGEKTLRADSTLYYRYSPFANLSSFGVFLDVRYWRGAGVFIEAAGFYVWVDGNGRLNCQLDSTTLTTPDPLPEEDVEIFIQVASETTSLSIYVNGTLEARTTVPDTLLPESPLSFLSAGVRCYQKVIAFSSVLTDGGVAVGAAAESQVGELFANEDIISAATISSQTPGILLPSVDIPGVPLIASSGISAINVGASTITLEDATGFVVDTTIFFTRGNSVRTRATVTARNANVLTLDSVAGLRVGDLAIYGDLDNPGRATVRLPVQAYDLQEISAVDVGNRQVTVGSTLAFDLSAAYVQSDSYADKAGVQILARDDVARKLTLDSVADIAVGDVIFQPSTELLVDPQNYTVRLQEDFNGVSVQRKGRDAIEIINQNPVTATVTPLLIINL